MGVCKICGSPLKADFEAAVARGLGPRPAGRAFGFDKSVASRHILHCMAQKSDSVPPVRLAPPEGRLRRLYNASARILRQAEKDGDGRRAMAAIETMHRLEKEIFLGRSPQGKGKPDPETCIVIKYDDPISGPAAPAVNAKLYLQKIACDMSWELALRVCLEAMVASSSASDAVKQAAEKFLDVLVLDREQRTKEQVDVTD